MARIEEKKTFPKAAKKQAKLGKKKKWNKQCFLSKKGVKPIGSYSSACIRDGWVFFSGVIGLMPEENTLAEGGFTAQAAQVLHNIEVMLAELQLSVANVVKTTVYMKDITQFAVFNQLYAEHFTADYPARSVVEVSNLPAGAELEMELIAVIPQKRIRC